MAGAVDAIGVLLAVAGGAWAAWAAWLLRAAGTPVLGRAVPTVLVEEGPYRFGRHPIYLGALAALAGVALATGQPFAALAALVLAVVVARRLVPREEAALQQRFGGWWRDYAGTVRRWL
jgi:protein-S-isoprenylcysteine O-methyltransferase Ste14